MPPTGAPAAQTRAHACLLADASAHALAGGLNYSKWDNIVDSDDEADGPRPSTLPRMDNAQEAREWDEDLASRYAALFEENVGARQELHLIAARWIAVCCRSDSEGGTQHYLAYCQRYRGDLLDGRVIASLRALHDHISIQESDPATRSSATTDGMRVVHAINTLAACARIYEAGAEGAAVVPSATW